MFGFTFFAIIIFYTHKKDHLQDQEVTLPELNFK